MDGFSDIVPTDPGISISSRHRRLYLSEGKAVLYLEQVPYDGNRMLEAIRLVGGRPEAMSPGRWISLLRGKPTRIPGCGRLLVLTGTPSGYTVKYFK